MDDVVVTGTGIVSPIGLDESSFKAALTNGTLGISSVDMEQDGESTRVFGGFVEGFDPDAWMESRVVEGSSPFTHYAVAAAAQAIRDAELDPTDSARTAVVMGTSMAGAPSLFEAQRLYSSEGPTAVSPKINTRAWPNSAAGQIALRWRLHGPLLTISTACASSIDAIGMGKWLVESRQADVAIVGGADACMSPVMFQAQINAGIGGKEWDAAMACRPFDANRTGIVEGEGAGVLILERGASARQRGISPKAKIGGYASLSDGFHPTSPNPSAEWELAAMTAALEQAQHVGIEEVTVVIAHATGTPIGDMAEIRAINGAFKAPEDIVAMSIKGHTGHTGGAAGVMGAVAAMNCMFDQQVPPTLGTELVDPEARFQVVTKSPLPWPVKAVQVNAFGFFGQNSSLVLAPAQ